MRVASGHVIGGRVQLDDAELPEGAAVTVLFPEDDETFEADPKRSGCFSNRLRSVNEAKRFHWSRSWLSFAASADHPNRLTNAFGAMAR
jgi:hypothetical protein